MGMHARHYVSYKLLVNKEFSPSNMVTKAEKGELQSGSSVLNSVKKDIRYGKHKV